MRRTYRSKKDVAAGFDHKDVVLSVDSKSSIFDAYCIQNINRVKREMSSGLSNSQSYKVRKRKYVKRLKEPKLVPDSMTESAYLTPDKSIHVNRTPDLFDQLLNSSTNASSPKTRINIKVKNMKQGVARRTYSRKKITKSKNNNKSSCDETESDKENSTSDESYSINTSNIKAHRLVIEKVKLASPICLDDSIDRVVRKFPVLNKFSRENITKSSDETCNNRFNKVVFNHTQSPLIQISPQCSTPFHEKYRGKSIYNFSPINLNLMNESEKSIDGKLVNNSVNIKPNHKNETDSIITFLPHEETKPRSADVNKTKDIINQLEKIEISHEYQTGTSVNENTRDKDSFLLEGEEIAELEIRSHNPLKNKQSIEISSLHTTEMEPFFGFPDCNTVRVSDDSNTAHNTVDDFNCINRNNIILDPQVLLQHTVSNFEDNDDINTSSNSSAHCNKNGNTETNNNTSENSSEFSESASLYDTCDSDNKSETSLIGDVQTKEPIVVMERLNDSVFQKYFEKMSDYTLNSENSIGSNCVSDSNENFSNIYESDYTSFKEGDSQDDSSNDSLNKDKLDDDSDESNMKINQFDDVQIVSSSENENTDSNEIEEEDKCISFVTTRRRNDITNNSYLFSLDNSYNSTSSATLDKTVLSNNVESVETDIIDDKTIINDSDQNVNIESNKDIKSDLQLPPKEEKFKKSLESVQIVSVGEQIHVNSESSRLLRESTYSSSEIPKDVICGVKQGIVLKPGKQWERSLSIYRRMTTMGDNFDVSILDEESVKFKGRKYRQSVISTMEMQEYQGSLHNESVFSRRSTFVSKPSRPSIKFFKDPNASNVSLSSSILNEDLEGFLNGDCDDTVIELSKLSIGDSEHEVTLLDKFHDTANRIVTAEDYVLRRCNQTGPILFDECYPDTVLKNCRKIGEGVYGEVFLFRAGDGRVRVMKIVPVAGDTRVNGEQQKGYHEIIAEIVIAMELSALRAPIPEIERQLDEGKEIDALDLQSVQNATDVFNEVLATRLVFGSYPNRLLDLWELYDESRGSENDSPAALPPHQRYLALELANAGQDLESYQFTNAEQAYSLFKQIALGLAVAEEALQFEHRDLHWGNVLIAPTDQKYATFVLRGRLYRVARRGVAAALIDYSLSRAARGGRALYNDLAADDALFEAVGDYQFDVYRLMRDRLSNDWKNYEPYTNILWLHYTVDKMITALRYTRTNTKIHKHYIAKLKEIKNRVLDYGSATQFILTDNEF